MTTIIARFSRFEASMYVVVCLGFCIALYADLLRPPAGMSVLDYFQAGEDAHRSYVVALVLAPLVLVMQLEILWQLIAGKGRAVWIAGGKLHFLNNYANVIFSRVPLEGIDHLTVAPARPFRSSAVVLHLKDGRRKYIPAMLLTEPAKTILPRLSAALADEV